MSENFKQYEVIPANLDLGQPVTPSLFDDAFGTDSWFTKKDSAPVQSLGFAPDNELLHPESFLAKAESQGQHERTDSMQNIQRDKFGNPTQYSIGPEDDRSEVKVQYANPDSKEPSPNKVEITRAGGKESIVYNRERSDPNDPSSPFSYTEARDGMRGDIQFADVEVQKDGRINVFFDYNRKRLAMTFDPKTGKEELP